MITWLNKSNLWVALGCGATYLTSAWLAGQPAIIFELLYVICCTALAYAYLHVGDKISRSSLRVLLIAVILLSYFLHAPWGLITLIAGGLVLLYDLSNLASLKLKIPWPSLREIPFVKPIAITLAWTLLSSAALSNEFSADGAAMWMIYAIQASWIFGLSISSDIRDMQIDRGKIATLAARWGAPLSKCMAFLMIVMSGVGMSFYMQSIPSFEMKVWEWITLLSFHFLCGMTIFWIKTDENWQKWTFLLDSFLIFRMLVVAVVILL